MLVVSFHRGTTARAAALAVVPLLWAQAAALPLLCHLRDDLQRGYVDGDRVAIFPRGVASAVMRALDAFQTRASGAAFAYYVCRAA